METNKEPIRWVGNMADDCTAIWCGLLLRTEWMFETPKGERIWWWAVSSIETGIELGSSHTHTIRASSGEEARKFAEDAAQPWLLKKGYSKLNQLELHNKRNLKVSPR